MPSTKVQYVRQVRRVLKPAGRWRAVEGPLPGRPLAPAEEAWYRAVREGFHVPSLLAAAETVRLLRQIGYVHGAAEDLTAQVAPAARRIVYQCYLASLVSGWGPDRPGFPGSSRWRENYQGQFRAGMAFSQGLLNGCFHYTLYDARKSSQADPKASGLSAARRGAGSSYIERLMSAGRTTPSFAPRSSRTRKWPCAAAESSWTRMNGLLCGQRTGASLTRSCRARGRSRSAIRLGNRQSYPALISRQTYPKVSCRLALLASRQVTACHL